MRYEYNEIRAAAIAADATQADINKLGEWFERYGGEYWNGFYYDADGLNLYPVCKKNDFGDFEIISYEFK